MNTNLWKRKLENGDFDQELAVLYGTSFSDRKGRYLRLIENYVNYFGPGDAVVLSAPGRTELAGNHTDHQQGHVLCAAITQDTLAAVSPSRDDRIVLVSEGFGEIRLSLDSLDPFPAEQGSSAALLRGVARSVRDMGYTIGGFRAWVTSDVPVGAGLSSSASFEILIAAIFSRLYNGDALSPLQLAGAGHLAETRYFGKPCGRMDQMACALGGIQMIDFADLQSPGMTAVDFSFRQAGYVLCVVDTGASHAGLTEDYAAIPREMAMAASAFGQPVLRYVNYSDFQRALPRLRRELPERAIDRAVHFFEEDRRVPEMAAALTAGDVERYRVLMQASGDSSRQKLRNIIPPSHPQSTEMARALDRCGALLRGRGAWRVHGGGFAGCVQCLVPEGMWIVFQQNLEEHYGPGSVRELDIRPVGVHALGGIFPFVDAEGVPGFPAKKELFAGSCHISDI